MTDRPKTPADEATPLIEEWLRDLPDDLAADLREEYEERAGILQFDGGLTRECAEWASLALLARRHPLKLLGVSVRRLEAGRYALTHHLSLSSPAGEPVAIELPDLLRECGPVVLLTCGAPEN